MTSTPAPSFDSGATLGRDGAVWHADGRPANAIARRQLHAATSERGARPAPFAATTCSRTGFPAVIDTRVSNPQRGLVQVFDTYDEAERHAALANRADRVALRQEVTADVSTLAPGDAVYFADDVNPDGIAVIVDEVPSYSPQGAVIAGEWTTADRSTFAGEGFIDPVKVTEWRVVRSTAPAGTVSADELEPGDRIRVHDLPGPVVVSDVFHSDGYVFLTFAGSPARRTVLPSSRFFLA